MEDYSSQAFIQSFIRFSCEVGYPKTLLPDEGSQLMKSCDTMTFNFKDVKENLYKDSKVEFQACPVGGHNMHGRVERKIQEVKKSIEKSFQNQRLSVIQWETIGSQIANCVNNMPLALGNFVTDFDVIDILTPNRLLLGRNNDRSPDGPLRMSTKPDKFIKCNNQIFDAWFEAWLLSHIPVLMDQPKWYRTSHNLQIDDVVLFIKRESSLKSLYQYGMVKNVYPSRDGIVRKVNIKYRNSDEKTFRETFRSARELVLIHAVDDVAILDEIGDMALHKMQN